MSLADNITDVAFYSNDDVDKVIGVASGTIDSPAPTALGQVTNTTQTFNPGFGDGYYVRGIFSTDSGTSWNDFNVNIPNLTTPAQPVLNTVSAIAAVSQAGILNVIAVNWYDIVHSTSSNYSVMWKAALIAKNNQGSISPLPVNEVINFDSRLYNYQKIAFQGEIPVTLTSGSGFTTTVTHNLGYVPRVRAFFQHYTSQEKMTDLWNWTAIETRPTTTDVTFFLEPTNSFINATGQIEYRIYYDQ